MKAFSILKASLRNCRGKLGFCVNFVVLNFCCFRCCSIRSCFCVKLIVCLFEKRLCLLLRVGSQVMVFGLRCAIGLVRFGGLCLVLFGEFVWCCCY